MALIKTINELNLYVGVAAAAKLELITPLIKRAEQKYIIPEIGQAQYDDLNTAYNSGNALSVQLAALLPQVQLPLANFAALLYIPFAEVIMSEAGIQRMETASNKTAHVRQVERLEASLITAGYEGLEAMLKFLEANKTTYTIWAGSSAYTISKELFINNASEFQQYVNIDNSRRLFQKMRQTIKKIEDFTIKSIVGSDLFAAIKTQITAGTLTAENTALMGFIKPAVAHLAIADSLTEMIAQLSPESGLINISIGAMDRVSQKEIAKDNFVDARIKKELADGQVYLAQLSDYLIEKVSIYPLYENSSAYSPTSNATFQNKSGNKGFFAV